MGIQQKKSCQLYYSAKLVLLSQSSNSSRKEKGDQEQQTKGKQFKFSLDLEAHKISLTNPAFSLTKKIMPLM